ncbi:hypothetical protein SKAU_G00381090 [Synaphobranchus kaupii]|uniref:Uncharacterized protein n=1 Tax=Synaphobranchus kaupii TaxID=118154 RepID=A0A9Q1EDQ1_SYNKA|nr:hypothetical protein SKAU_G00381090 [Synaphobranchus kaupii]
MDKGDRGAEQKRSNDVPSFEEEKELSVPLVCTPDLQKVPPCPHFLKRHDPRKAHCSPVSNPKLLGGTPCAPRKDPALHFPMGKKRQGCGWKAGFCPTVAFSRSAAVRLVQYCTPRMEPPWGGVGPGGAGNRHACDGDSAGARFNSIRCTAALLNPAPRSLY